MRLRLLGMSRSYESSLNFASLTAPRGPAARQRLGDGRRLALQHRLLEATAALRSWQSRWGRCPGAYVWTLSKRAYVWTLSKNFTDMPMSADEWHVWLEIAKVGTRGAVWPRGGCAALRNLKRQKCSAEVYASTQLEYEQFAGQAKGSEGMTAAPVQKRGTRRGQIVAKIQKC